MVQDFDTDYRCRAAQCIMDGLRWHSQCLRVNWWVQPFLQFVAYLFRFLLYIMVLILSLIIWSTRALKVALSKYWSDLCNTHIMLCDRVYFQILKDAAQFLNWDCCSGLQTSIFSMCHAHLRFAIRMLNCIKVLHSIQYKLYNKMSCIFL